ncbi:MAG: glycosyltransferase family 4 protein [Ignavibacteria bacterium]|nr:glycosyltransferase family 4 protein [Ignavibacteria bacterium]
MTIGYDLSMVFGAGGIQRYARELVSHIVALDQPFDFRILTRSSKENEIRKIAGSSRSDIRPVLPHELALGPLLKGVTRKMIARQWARHMSDVDLVHYHEGGRWFPSVKRFVVTIHDLFPLDESIEVYHNLRASFPKVVSAMVEHAEHIIVPSEYVKQTFSTYFPNAASPISVIPLAAGDDFAPLHSAPSTVKGPYLLWVGRLDPRKNLRRILQAWMQIPTSLRRASKFVLIGPWEQKHFNREYDEVKKFINEPNLELRSHISHAEHLSLLSNACGLVFPSIAEGFGLPVLEAMKCGCPVLTSSLSSLPEVAGDAALYVDPFDTNSIAHGMEVLLTDPDVRNNLRVKGLTQAQEFSWNITAKKTCDVYKAVLGI